MTIQIQKNDPKALSRDWIIIRGAREHNLKNVTVAIPKNSLTVITGPSGSGKSSLALDVLFTEGKRRYMESLSSYARQFLGVARKPDFDSIEGLCPAIAIEQKTVGANPRSTVGTITEIYDYLRVLFARIGVPHCPDCGITIQAESPDNITKLVIKEFLDKTITISAPLIVQKKGEFVQLLLQLYHQGYYRFNIDGATYRFKSEEDIKNVRLAKTYKHSIDLLIDVIEVTEAEKGRVQEAVEKSCQLADGMTKIIVGTKTHVYSSKRMCLQCSKAFPELEPRFFSFNSPLGACTSCHGLGFIHHWPMMYHQENTWNAKEIEFDSDYVQEKICKQCNGQRLNQSALSVKIGGKNIMQIGELSIKEALSFFSSLHVDDFSLQVGGGLIKEITSRLQFLYNVGLSYLSLNRSARTLSGGEGQRIRLATQIGSSLCGVLYILDEPSIGLHQRDNDRLINTLKALRDQGNTVVVVEHDMDTMTHADYIIDMGPAAGMLGGNVTAADTPLNLGENSLSLTGAYLSGKKFIPKPLQRRTPSGWLKLSNVSKNNLKDVTVSFPVGVMCCVSGVSGSGKSTLVLDELVPALKRDLSQSRGFDSSRAEIAGYEHIDSIVDIDQSPIGRTPRSNPATYLGIFDDIRKLFALLPESNARGYKPGRFSFNVHEGRCFECKGEGTISVSMQFLADVVMVCKSCKGRRFNNETLAITYKEKNIAEILEMTALEARTFFSAHSTILKRLTLLCDVGLDYIKLGQPSTTLSGGEAQRIKLVDELAKRGTKTLYVLDEPTTGLHTSDIEKLLKIFERLVQKGNSIIIIEHNLDVLKTADYLIDLGPEGGDEGGTIIAQGTPEVVAQSKKSHTGFYLKKVL